MSEPVRMLNDEGISQFEKYVDELRDEPTLPPPFHLLTSPATSVAAPFVASLAIQPLGRPYGSAYELGSYLCAQVFNDVSKPLISRDHGLWNWLALFLFDELCPSANGRRAPLETAAYVLSKDFKYTRYYRHLVRSAWVLVSVHGHFAKVLLTANSSQTSPVSVRTEMQMQLSATQEFVESKSVVETAYALYFDNAADRMKVGSSSKGAGAPRRLVTVLNQFDLTYDLHASPAATLVALLPTEFDRFRGKAKPIPKRKQSNLIGESLKS
jgi:hypothetical protein